MSYLWVDAGSNILYVVRPYFEGVFIGLFSVMFGFLLFLFQGFVYIDVV